MHRLLGRAYGVSHQTTEVHAYLVWIIVHRWADASPYCSPAFSATGVAESGRTFERSKPFQSPAVSGDLGDAAGA
jgi:hypothetical protein